MDSDREGGLSWLATFRLRLDPGGRGKRRQAVRNGCGGGGGLFVDDKVGLRHIFGIVPSIVELVEVDLVVLGGLVLFGERSVGSGALTRSWC